MAQAKQVGAFRFDEEGNLYGPSEYWREQGEALHERILTGKDNIFNHTAALSPDVPTAILVRIQTDYAAWLGANQLFRKE